MQAPDASKVVGPPSWKLRWIAWRNRVLASPRFQAFASATPGLRRIARNRARQLFDRIAGFTYSQIVLAAVESGLLDAVARGPATLGQIAHAIGLGGEATARLVRAAAAILRDMASFESAGVARKDAA